MVVVAITTFATLKTAIDNWGHWGGVHSSRIPEWVQLSEDWVQQNLRVRGMETHVQLPIQKFVGISAANVGGTANAITITNDTATGSYVKGESYKITAEFDNTSTVTVNVDGKGNKAIEKADSAALVAGDIIKSGVYYITYNGTEFIIVPDGGYPLPTNYLQFRRVYIPGDPVQQIRPLSPAMFWSKRLGGVARPKHYTIEGEFIVFGPHSPDASYFVQAHFYKKFAALSADGDTNWVLTNARGLYLYGALAEGYAFLGDTANVLKYTGMRDALLTQTHEADKRDRFSGDALVMETDVPRD